MLRTKRKKKENEVNLYTYAISTFFLNLIIVCYFKKNTNLSKLIPIAS